MPIMKRASSKAQEIAPDLVISRGLWGYYAINRRYRRQQGTLVRQTAGEVLDDLRSGQRPVELPELPNADSIMAKLGSFTSNNLIGATEQVETKEGGSSCLGS